MDVLDSLSFGVFSYLQKHQCVSHVDYKPHVGAFGAQLDLWNQKNHPCTIPEDMRLFYTITNGLSIKWFALFQNEPAHVGCFTLNSIQDMQRQRIERFETLCRPVDRHRIAHLKANDGVTFFLLESSPQYGDVALVFFAENSQVWFRDLRGTWSFLAETFTNYYHMMVSHLGLLGWQTIFTDGGLHPSYRPWFYLFIPRRMAMDERELSEEQERFQSQRRPVKLIG